MADYVAWSPDKSSRHSGKKEKLKNSDVALENARVPPLFSVRASHRSLGAFSEVNSSGKSKLFHPAVAIQELLRRTKRCVMHFLRAFDQAEASAKLTMQGLGVVSDNV